VYLELRGDDDEMPVRAFKSQRENQVSEEAKAVAEVAKASGKAIDASRELGGFVSRFISGPLEQASGIVTDKLMYMRWERQVRFMRRSEDFLKEAGLLQPTRPVPLSVVIPLIQAASLEEDDTLQDMWARLLVNAGNQDSGVHVRRAFVSILEDFGPLEARCLEMIAAIPEPLRREGVRTVLLPDAIEDVPSEAPIERPSEDVELALWNLVRLGCIESAMMWAGASIGEVTITALGEALVRACAISGSA